MPARSTLGHEWPNLALLAVLVEVLSNLLLKFGVGVGLYDEKAYGSCLKLGKAEEMGSYLSALTGALSASVLTVAGCKTSCDIVPTWLTGTLSGPLALSGCACHSELNVEGCAETELAECDA